MSRIKMGDATQRSGVEKRSSQKSERTDGSDGGFDEVIAAPVGHGSSYCGENSVPEYITLGHSRSWSTGGESWAPGGHGHVRRGCKQSKAIVRMRETQQMCNIKDLREGCYWAPTVKCSRSTNHADCRVDRALVALEQDVPRGNDYTG